jgi:hypothetical protein
MESFSDEETEFELVVAETSDGMDGVRRGEPTGEVRCVECGRVADVIEEIPHKPDCPQRFVTSRWWAAQFQS